MDAFVAWWDGLIGWLTTPGMWTPLALATLAIAAGAIVVSVVAIRQVASHVPRPVIVPEHSGIHGNTSTESPTWGVWLWNRGNAIARDMRVMLVDKRDGSERFIDAIDTLEFKRPLRVVAMLSDQVMPAEFDESGEHRHEFGPVETGHLRLVVTWREAPDMTKLQRRTYKP